MCPWRECECEDSPVRREEGDVGGGMMGSEGK